MLKGADFTCINMYAMCCNDFCLKESLLLHIRNDRDAIFATHVIHFERGFREMGMQRNIKFLCEGWQTTCAWMYG